MNPSANTSAFDLTGRLAAAWPSARPGFHRLDFPDLGARLDLFIGEAEVVRDPHPNKGGTDRVTQRLALGQVQGKGERPYNF